MKCGFLSIAHNTDISTTTNVKNMKCTGLKAVSYPDTRMIIKGSTVQTRTDTRIFYIWCYRAFILNQMSKFKVGQKAEVNTEIQPESEYWEKGYWKIPKGHKSIITDIDEEGNCLIEYIEATFYVDSSFLNAL